MPFGGTEDASSLAFIGDPATRAAVWTDGAFLIVVVARRVGADEVAVE